MKDVANEQLDTGLEHREASSVEAQGTVQAAQRPRHLARPGVCGAESQQNRSKIHTRRHLVTTVFCYTRHLFQQSSPCLCNQLPASDRQSYMLISLLHIHVISLVPVHVHRHHHFLRVVSTITQEIPNATHCTAQQFRRHAAGIADL